MKRTIIVLLALIVAILFLSQGASAEQYRINSRTAANAAHLEILLNNLYEEIEELNALTDELLADHATQKLATDAVETLIEEIHDDHATVIALEAALKTLINDVRSQLVGDGVLGATGLALGTTIPNVANGAFDFMVDGAVSYTKAANAAGTALSGDAVPQDKYGAWALDIGSNGTVDITPADANAAGYTPESSAIAGLPAVAADHARMGWCTAISDSGAFTPGTTALSAANVTDAYYDATTVFAGIGAAVSESAPATLTAPKPPSGPATLTAPAATARVKRGK